MIDSDKFYRWGLWSTFIMLFFMNVVIYREKVGLLNVTDLFYNGAACYFGINALTKFGAVIGNEKIKKQLGL